MTARVACGKAAGRSGKVGCQYYHPTFVIVINACNISKIQQLTVTG